VVLFGVHGGWESANAGAGDVRASEKSAKRRIARMREIGIWSEGNVQGERGSGKWAIGD